MTDALLTAGIFLISLAWFLFHAVPTVYFGDCGELLCDLTRGFVPHPTGFPAYLLTATPFAHLGPFTANIHSAIWAAASVALLYNISSRLLMAQGYERSRVRIASLAAAAALLGSCTLTLHAACARVYTLQLALWLMGLYWILEYRTSARWALGAGLLLGFSSGTHTLFVTLLPFAFLYLWDHSRRPWKLIPWVLSGLFLGASIHLWIPLRSALHPAVDWGTPSTFEAWWRYITQASYGFKMLARGGEGTGLFITEMLRIGRAEFTPSTWLVSALGFYILLRRDRILAAALACALVSNVALMYLYGGEFDLNVLYRYFLPAYAILALWVGQGWLWLIEKTPTLDELKGQGRVILLAVFVTACLWVPTVHWGDLADSTDAWHYAVNLLRSVPRGATLEVASDAQIPPVAYAFYVRGLRPDLRLVEWYGTLFPETFRRMQQDPILTKDKVEKAFLDEGGGILFVPSQRGVSAPLICRPWGLSHRLSDRPLAHDPEPPPLEAMCFRMTDAEFSDAEAQITMGEVLLQRADRALELDDKPDALSTLQVAEGRCPLAPNVLVDAAVAYGKAGASDRVEPTLLKALRLRPNHYTGNLNLGLLYASRGMYNQAMRCLQTAARAVPQDPLAPQLIRQVQSMMGVQP